MERDCNTITVLLLLLFQINNQSINHRLVVTGDDAVLTQVSKGRKIPSLDIATTQEEADLIITQQAIHLAKEDG